jgi:hypothetical protein
MSKGGHGSSDFPLPTIHQSSTECVLYRKTRRRKFIDATFSLVTRILETLSHIKTGCFIYLLLMYVAICLPVVAISRIKRNASCLPSVFW